MRTGNPTLNSNTFSQVASTDSDVMTIQGTVNKSFILIACVMLTSVFTWQQFFAGSGSIFIYMLVGGIGGLIFSIITFFKKTWAPVTTPIYALLQGLFLGGISAYYANLFDGIVMHAVALTLGVFLCLLLIYKSGMIKVTENLRMGIAAATGAVALLYLVTFILGMFGVNVGFIHNSSWLSIGLSIGVVVIASLNLVLDFDFIEQGAEQGAPKYMEWYAAFGLIVTLIWLYLEILRLLAKLRGR